MQNTAQLFKKKDIITNANISDWWKRIKCFKLKHNSFVSIRRGSDIHRRFWRAVCQQKLATKEAWQNRRSFAIGGHINSSYFNSFSSSINAKFEDCSTFGT